GFAANGTFSAGAIDDVQAYGRALTASEVQTLYQQGIGAFNQPPIVTANADKTSGTAPLTVTFTLTAQDPDGTIATYAWDFGDSSTATEQNPTHTYNAAGTYTATVTVTDNAGATATAEIVIKVLGPPGKPVHKDAG
ncbi:PKD domain-containing protein, partial [Candidatus Poribacteria bacterium]|nr:PKD domain-containing protein [Candidatus Poribacteria bacterium]